jgi:plasmid stability protein
VTTGLKLEQTRKPACWYDGAMKTTLDLPDDLIRAVKIRAAEEHRTLKELMADLLRSGLAQKRGAISTARRRLKLPLIECAHAAGPDEEMTSERVAAVLLDEEAQGHRETLR